MPATDGYVETMDGTLLDYRVDLPPTPPSNGQYDVVVFYSGYRPGLRPSERRFPSSSPPDTPWLG